MFNFKKTNISNINGIYTINMQDMLKFNAPETIKEMKIIDVVSGKEYNVETIGIDKKIMLKDDNYLELDNNFEFNKDYIANNTLYSFVRDSIISGYLKVAKNIENGSYEVMIESESAGYSKILGDTIILGKEYRTSIGKLSVNSNGDEEYCLYLYPLLGSSAEIIRETRLIVKKRLIIRPYSEINDYLESIPKNGSRSIYISSFVQSEGNSIFGNIELNDLEKYYKS